MILLVDMDAFFAAVEQAHHPALRGQPVIVCGDPERRGVVTAASYEARPFGVHAGMPLARARRLCPQAHYVEGNPEKYVATSLALLELYTRWTPLVEPFSVDEAFMGLGGTRHDHPAGAERVAREIQAAVRDRYMLSASIGGGPSKLVAKMAAGLAKPGGIAVLDVNGFRTAFWPRPARELWGVGEKLEARLGALGLRTIGDLARCPAGVLADVFGEIGPQLRDAARGEDRTPLVPYYRGVDAKSMGHEVTLAEDSDNADHLQGLALRLSDQVGRRLRQEGYVGRVVSIKLRDAGFRTRIRQRALDRHGDDTDEIFRVAWKLFGEIWDGGRVRLLGVTVSQLARAAGSRQEPVFDRDRRSRELCLSVDALRDRFGEASLVRAGALRRSSRLRHVPFGAARPPRS